MKLRRICKMNYAVRCRFKTVSSAYILYLMPVIMVLITAYEP